MKNTLPESTEHSIPKKDAIIIWHCDNDIGDCLLDFRVHHRKDHKKIYDTSPCYADKDIGACRADWDSWDLENVLFYFFVIHRYRMTQKMIELIISELSRIPEWNERLQTILSFKYNMLD